MPLEVGQPYLLKGMIPSMWDNSHEQFGQPSEIAVEYLGSLQGTRRWFLFEVRIELKEAGVLLMNEHDIEQLTVEKLSITP